MLLLSGPALMIVALAWGLLLLIGLSSLLARERRVAVLPEVGRHLVLAFAVIVASRLIGAWVEARIH